MTLLGRVVACVLALSVLIGVCSASWWIIRAPTAPAAAKSSAPAATTNKVSEAELGVVKLSEEAAQRLGVQTATVEKRMIERVRVYGGEVTIPAGRTILVAAPLSGTIQAPADGLPLIGQKVLTGQQVVALLPLFSPEAAITLAASRADVEGQLKNAQTQLAVTKLALDRAQRLYRDEAGSKRSVEEAQGQFDVAQRGAEAAQARLDILTRAVGDASSGRSSPIPITAPETGMLRNIAALPGQSVPAGGALFEVVDLDEVWIRVPVYVGDQTDIASDKPAEIGKLNMLPGDATWPATPVPAPPSANPLNATVDLFYALKTDSAHLTPGQRVGVKLLLNSSGDSLTMPWSAVVHDLQGGTWVYEELSPRVYKRQRVLVRYAVDGNAVLASGPAPGTKIVTEGAVELFGAETGFSK